MTKGSDLIVQKRSHIAKMVLSVLDSMKVILTVEESRETGRM